MFSRGTADLTRTARLQEAHRTNKRTRAWHCFMVLCHKIYKLLLDFMAALCRRPTRGNSGTRKRVDLGGGPPVSAENSPPRGRPTLRAPRFPSSEKLLTENGSAPP